MKYVECQIAYSTYALSLLPALPSVAQANTLVALGSGLLLRHRRTMAWEQFESVSAIITEAERLGHLFQMSQLQFLLEKGSRLVFEYERTAGSVAPLEEGIRVLETARDMTSEEHPLRLRILLELGIGYHKHYMQGGDPSDSAHLHRVQAQSIAVCPRGHRDWHVLQYGLAQLKYANYQIDGDFEALKAAIEHVRECCDLAPGPKFEFDYVLTHSRMLYYRFNECGHESDLQSALEMSQRCITLEPTHIHAINTITTILNARFLRYGRWEDLDESIRLSRDTMERVTNINYRSVFLNNLGKFLMLRFEHLFDMNDLNEAIELFCQALDLRQPPYLEWAAWLFNLAEALKKRYLRTQDYRDVQSAFSLHEQWFEHRAEATTLDGEHTYLELVAELYRLRYLREHQIEDIHRAIELQEEAARKRPSGHSSRNLAMTSLAAAYRMRYEELHLPHDAKQAQEIQLQVAEQIEFGHRDRPLVLLELARTLLLDTPPPQTSRSALQSFMDAMNDENCSAAVRLSEGADVLRRFEAAARRGTLAGHSQHDLLRAYQMAVHLFPQVAFFGMDVNSRFQLLSVAPDVAYDASAHAIRLDEAQTALEILEEGRAVFWTQYLQLRSSFDNLPVELQSALIEVSRMLETGALQPSMPQKADATAKSNYEKQRAERLQLSKTFDSLLQQARTLPGHDRFMLHDIYSTLSQAAQRSPVLILLASSTFCGALLIKDPSGPPERLSFDLDISRLGEIGGAVQFMRRNFRQITVVTEPKTSPQGNKHKVSVLQDLWTGVVQPVIRALQWKVS